MNILFLTLLDFSSINEASIYTDLMREFISNGHRVYMISPSERRKNISTSLIKSDNHEILKLKIGNVQKTGFIEKGISTLLLENQFKRAIKKYFNDVKFDLIIYSTPPVTLYKAVEYVKKRDNSKTYLLLKDILPQGAVDLDALRTNGYHRLIYNYFKVKEQNLYRISDIIGCMSKANVDYILKHNPTISGDQVEICPNSIQPLQIDKSHESKVTIRKKYNIPMDKVIFIYGGNLGKPQGIDFLIECIRKNESNQNSFFLIVGSGTEFTKLKTYFDLESPRNAMLLSQMPKNDYEMLANSCDVGLIFLDKRFTIPNFPSRVLSYMQASMPVLAATDLSSDIGQVISEGEFGYWCESNNSDYFNVLVEKMSNVDLIRNLGKNAHKYLLEHYTANHSYNIIMNHFEEKR